MTYDNILAKTEPRKVTLIQHSLDVMNMACKLCDDSNGDKELTPVCVAAALLHDIGKATAKFQAYMQGEKNGIECPYEHNTLSLILVTRYIAFEGVSEVQLEALRKSIAHHHPVSQNTLRPLLQAIDEEDNDILTPADVKNVKGILEILAEEYNSLGFALKVKVNEKPVCANISDEYFSKDPSNDGSNPLLAYVSAIVRAADVEVSNGGDGNLFSETPLKGLLQFDNLPCPNGYDERLFSRQKEVSVEASENLCSEIDFPTGQGKTLIGLMYMINIGVRAYWVCPTNETARSLYKSIKKELKVLGLEETVSVGLLITNKFEYGGGLGDKNDLIVTNIDNFSRPCFRCDNHKKMLFDVHFRTVVFDEYHMYNSHSNALLSTFITLLRSRKFALDSHTLLLSATPPNGRMLKGIPVQKIETKNIDFPDRVYKIIHIKQGEYHDIEGALITANSVAKAQENYENKLKGDYQAMCLHGRFTDDDLKEKMRILENDHGKGKEEKLTVFATNIVSTAHDYSFKKAYIIPMPLSEVLQTMGRVNRHGEHEIAYIYLMDKGWIQFSGSEYAAVNEKYNHSLMAYEYKRFSKMLPDGEYTLKQIYDVYYSIINDEEYQKQYREQYSNWLLESFDYLSQMPYLRPYKGPTDDYQYISSKRNIRTGSDKRNGEELVDLFVTCQGIPKGSCMQMQCMLKDLDDTSLAEKFVKTWEENPIKRVEKHENKLNILIGCAKCSKTPFYLGKRFTYNKEVGIKKERN